MAEYAYIFDNQIKEIVDLDPGIHAQWVTANNPKALVYRPVIRQPPPVHDEKTQAVDPVATVFATSVVFGWTIRPKTADELRKVWTSFEFLNRFTPAERAAIRAGSASDAALADFLMMSQAAQEIVSDDPMTGAGMDYLVSLGILTPVRRAEILP